MPCNTKVNRIYGKAFIYNIISSFVVPMAGAERSKSNIEEFIDE